MAATTTQVSQSVVVREKEWVKIFPKQVTDNYTSSVTFIKHLTVVAVSMITYLKNAFPEDSYITETFAGLQLKILTDNDDQCADNLAHFVTGALQQAFEAFDKKYIHRLALCFYEQSCEPENLLEYHIFEYSYNPEGAVLEINSKSRNSDSRSIKCSLEKVKARTTMFVRSLSMYLMQQTNSELPPSFDVSLRLYYNEDAPEGYQAPGFSAARGPDPLAPSLAEAVRVGRVDTPYHALVARSYTRAPPPPPPPPPPASAEPAPSENSPVLSESENIDFQDSPVGRVKCACNREDVDGLLLVTCQSCRSRQHAVCYGYLSAAPRQHGCGCVPGRADPRLMALVPRRRESLCMVRRTLALCRRWARLSGARLQQALCLNERGAGRMIKFLQTHEIVPKDEPDTCLKIQRKINHIHLKLILKHFFQEEEEKQDSMVDRLMAETIAIEEDPLGEVLSPLEQITLHNTSALGKVVTPPHPTRRSEDKTLQEYRKALKEDHVTEELPLSGAHNPVKDVEKIGKRKPLKRKTDDEDWMPKLRSGTRAKRVRAN